MNFNDDLFNLASALLIGGVVGFIILWGAFA